MIKAGPYSGTDKVYPERVNRTEVKRVIVEHYDGTRTVIEDAKAEAVTKTERTYSGVHNSPLQHRDDFEFEVSLSFKARNLEINETSKLTGVEMPK